MTLTEVCRLFARSRRTVMRWVDEEKLPEPTEYDPMSWDAREVRAARRRMREETISGHKHRNGRRTHKSRRRVRRNGARA